MIIIGVDYHAEFQQIASVDTDTGELLESVWRIPTRRRSFVALWRGSRYESAWKPAGTHGGSERLLAELQFELWIGDAAKIRPNECASRRRIARTHN